MTVYKEKGLSERAFDIATSDLKLMLGAALLRGWDITKFIWLYWWEGIIALTLLVLVTGSDIISQALFMALVLLAARPRAGARGVRYFLASTPALIMMLWALSMALMGWGLVTLQQYTLGSWHTLLLALRTSAYHLATASQLLGALSYLALMVFEVLLLVPYGLLAWSAYALVIALWLVDTVPGAANYREGIGATVRTVTHGWLFFAAIALLATICMHGLQAVLVLWLPLSVSRFMVAVVVAPWYSALVANWYAYVRYR